MKRLLLFVWVGILFLTGCGQKDGLPIMKITPPVAYADRSEGGTFAFETDEPARVCALRGVDQEGEQLFDRMIHSSYLNLGLPRSVCRDEECEVVQLNLYAFQVTVAPNAGFSRLEVVIDTFETSPMSNAFVVEIK